SPDYIPGPQAPPLPDYIPGPEAPPSPDYILGPEYPEYLPPADDVFPAEEQPLPAAVSPSAESPGYIADSEPEMDPEEEEDGDDEKSEGDSIEYPTSRGDDDDDGDDLSEDDSDDEDEEESSDSEGEEEEHLASTVPALALHSSISAFEDSDQTEPFEEGKTAATPPPSAYHVASKISVRPHIPMPFRSESKRMTAKYCPRGEVKKLEVELWNLKVKDMDITSYTLLFQELALLCGRMFLEELDKIERYVGRLPKMIRENVMSYKPKSMQKAIEFANDQMDQKLLGIADRQADNKRKFDNTLRNQQNLQPFKRNNNVAWAYAAGSREKKPYGGTKPFKRTGHIARDYRNRVANTNNNNNNNNYNSRRAIAAYQGVPTYFECGAQGHFKNNCPKLGNIF
nr:hypothetical protein [Tanacetum cinerariifolium]